jgi:DNA gyrase inhibitor GyrI
LYNNSIIMTIGVRYYVVRYGYKFKWKWNKRRRGLMSNLDVRIVRLEPSRVVAAYAFGSTPEICAWESLLSWAVSKGLLNVSNAANATNAPNAPTVPRFFGFNNPVPDPGSPNYGYEQWMTVAPDVTANLTAEVTANSEVQAKEFSGGLYAVTRCRLSEIRETWKRLTEWNEEGPYRLAHHQWLEECLTPPVPVIGTEPDLVYDLYLPIAK